MLFIIFWFAHDSCEVIKIMSVKLHYKGSQFLELVIKVQRFKKALVLKRQIKKKGQIPGGALPQ